MSIYDDNDEKNDFFENSEVPEKKVEPKKPVYTPDDPRYWEEPEDEFEHLRPTGRTNWKLWLWVAGVAILAGLLWAGYLRVFSPYMEQAAQYGYVEQIEKRGDIIQTYEGVLLPYKNLMDSTRVYEGDFIFSTNDPAVAARLKEMQFANLPVRVIYSVYHTAMPWRGDRKIIITRVDSVNERDILPPDRQPEYLKESAK
jgi:hypothetical protein